MAELDATSEREKESPQTPREIALDNMCSTLKVAYRDWIKREGERKTA